MSRTNALRPVLILLALAAPALAAPDLDAIRSIARCQKAIGREGAKYAQRVVKSSLHCTEEIADCQVQCELGAFGPPCDTNPPPCCDSDDPSSNQAFGACMADAQAVCNAEESKRAVFETNKQASIIASCDNLTLDQLCGASTPGLNFITLNAGCQALDPNYTCNLANLVNCVGGPLERALLDQISAVLHPRASDAVAALNLEAQFPDLPISRKVKGQVAEGKVDVWQFTAQAGDDVIVKVNTRDDTGTGMSTLHPVLALLDGGFMSVADTADHTFNCAVPTACGAGCPLFKRSLPFSGTFHLAVQAFAGNSCTGGKYKLILISPGGQVPTLVRDDADSPS